MSFVIEDVKTIAANKIEPLRSIYENYILL